MQEELGLEVRVERALWIVENFWARPTQRPVHELGWYFLVTLPPGCKLLRKEDVVHGIDGETHFDLRWFPIDGLRAVELFPVFLRTGLAALPTTLEHVVERK
jgi:8-oxo-dGTP pyrophosphatase MutT (NUDIX family)